MGDRGRAALKRIRFPVFFKFKELMNKIDPDDEEEEGDNNTSIAQKY